MFTALAVSISVDGEGAGAGREEGGAGENLRETSCAGFHSVVYVDAG